MRLKSNIGRWFAGVLLLLSAYLGLSFSPVSAEKIKNNVAVFAALDKVSARISHLEVPLNTTVEFGALLITARTCFTRPPTEPPHTTAFVEIEEVKLNDSKETLFSGWMFAESPGIHGVEHPVFDVWLTSCKTL
ncbi:MAG: DUF2155 domain-containing protein [Hyphomicrobiaceae bacterium]|nr:DUF2155 domain-containing protein [Hyphomicrobiaceae bacterium]